MNSTVRTFESHQAVGLGFNLPARMTALRAGRGLALVSPTRIGDELAEALTAMGPVKWLVAPNLFHHLHIGEARRRFPQALLLAPRALAKKRPDLTVDHALEDGLPGELAEHVTHVPLQGADRICEHVLFDRASGTLVATDLVFNVTKPEGLVTKLILSLVGANGCLAQSRSWRFFTNDDARFRESLAAVLELPILRLVMAHGEVVEEHAHDLLRQALGFAATPAALTARVT